jgi:ABC-type antimicrobial peptide transport system permease subunit
VELSLPVITELANWVYANQFAGIIFKAVLATLFFLSFLLVSNFITLLIDDKLTSIGILRVSGTSQRALIFFLAFQSLRLLLPAVLFGLFLSTLIQLVWPTFHTTYKTLGHILFNRFHYDYQINQYL